MNAKVGNTLNLSTIDIVADVLGTPSVDSTSNAECRSQDLLDTACERLTQALEFHRSRNLNDFIERNVPTVFDILLLLSITRRFLERSNDK